MSDKITFSLETAGLFRAFDALGELGDRLVRDVADVTSDRIVAEAKKRLQRQLGTTSVPNKARPDLGQGKTVAGITKRPDFSGKGFIVVAERNPFMNLPLWLEKGTKRGMGKHPNVARSFFYVSALLEEGNHLRRVKDAVEQAIRQTGLGA